MRLNVAEKSGGEMGRPWKKCEKVCVSGWDRWENV